MSAINNTYAIAALVVCLSAQNVRAEGEKITEVVVKGNRRIESAAILNVVKTKAGDILYGDKIDVDIRSIYKLAHFTDVKAESANVDGGVVLSFIVVEKPIVREVKFEGTKEISLEKVRDAFGIKSNAVFSQKEMAQGSKKVKKLYADEGYYLAEIDASSEKRSPTEVNIIVKVTEGNKVLIRTIDFDGNRSFTAKKLRGLMETKEKWFLSWLTGAGTYKDEVLKNDANLIADHYFNNGYVNVKVGEPQVKILEDKSGLSVTVGITEGEQFRVGEIGYKGDLLDSADIIKQKTKIKKGEVFSRAILRGDVVTLTDIYADKGYAFANVSPLSKINSETKTIDITFDFEKGEKVYIDKITIAGNTKTRDKVVRRELKLAEGDLYSSTGLKKSKQSLMNLGFFEEANLSTTKGSADNKLNLNVDVKEKPTGTFSIGAGYSSLDGIIGQGSVQQSNFLGLGLKANASVSFGSKSQTYNLGVTEPHFLDSKWTLGGDLYRIERDYIDFTKRATGGDIKAGYPLNDEVSTFWIYRYEEKKVFNESDAFKSLDPRPETSSTTSSIQASITRNTTDYRLDPTTGMVNNVSIEYAGLGGTNRYLRYAGDTTLFYPGFWNTVFSIRGSLGYIQELGKEVPIDEKYYLGGISTIRGFQGRKVSPYVLRKSVVDGISGAGKEEPVFVGGDKMATVNLEYSFPLLKDAGLKGVVFFDAGDSYSPNQTIFSSMKMSYGGGIRWFSPIGPLRLEYGIPVNPRTGIDDKGGRLEFSIGSFF